MTAPARASWARSATLPYMGLAVMGLCAANTLDLWDAWRTSPADAFGWLALLVWISPLFVLRFSANKYRLFEREEPGLLGLALSVSLVGYVGRVNALEHFGLILATAGLMKWRWVNLVWLAAGFSWTPAFGWLILAWRPEQVLTLRIALAACGAGALLIPTNSFATPRFDNRALARWALTVGVTLALAIGALWRFVPIEGAEQRLLRLPTQGEGFRSWSVPLKDDERKLLGAGIAVRRLYQVDGKQLLVSVVDGTLNRHAVHDPMYCFAGAGYRVVRDEQVAIDGGAARSVRIANQQSESNIMYWFSDGRTRHASILRYWWQTTLRRITFGASGDEPLLVIVQCDDVEAPDKLAQACQPLFGV